ncbi:hypothetical protein CHELA1G11_13603 [Hyphomicrobiales bacterium]|nr:hypothetical protein CHELA1G2_10712 [Hyphomicrobiales bacterium]CAH1672833.1 hypothetical protein CHELA1G11_13603 [Hyphomicrobiales bacterium]
MPSEEDGDESKSLLGGRKHSHQGTWTIENRRIAAQSGAVDARGRINDSVYIPKRNVPAARQTADLARTLL